MRARKIFLITISVCMLFAGIGLRPAFADSNKMVAYLCELGINFYKMGRYEDALVEFNKALMLDPKNKIAKQYTAIIFKEAVQTGTVPAKATPDVPKGTVPIRKEIVPAPQPKPTPSGTVPSGKQAIASTGTVFRGKETLGTVPSGKQAIASTGTVPMPKKLPAYKLTLQQLVAEAEKNIKLINQKMQKEATTKDQAIEKQLLDLERKKQK